MNKRLFRLSRIFTVSTVMALFALPSRAETLAEVFALAQQNDALFHAQQASYRAGQEDARIARSALLPQVSFNATSSETDIDDHMATAPVPGKYDTETDTETLTASQPLLNLEYWHNYQSGVASSQQSSAQFFSDQQQLVVRVVKAYTDVLNAVDSYKTARAEEAALARQLDQTKQRFEVGLAAITDVYESQASFDNAAVNVLNARGAVGIAFEALDAITGNRVASIAPLSEDYVITQPEPQARDAWVNKALSGNADLKISEHARQAALQNARAKRAAHLPTITASWQKSRSETDSDLPAAAAGFIDADRDTEVIAVNFNVPLFTGGGTSASRRQAWEQYNAAAEQYNYAKRSTVQAARSFHLAVTTDVARVNAQKQAIISAQSALDATEAGYEAGTRNIVDVLNAERALYNAQRLWHASRYQYINDLLQLKKVAGELTGVDIENTNQFIDASLSIPRSEFE